MFRVVKPPIVLAITGASAALAVSDIPFEKTIAGVRVGLIDGKYIVNPTFEQRKQSQIDLVVAGSRDGIVMVEAGAKRVTEEQVVEALNAGHAAIKQIVDGIEDLAKEAGKSKLKVAKKEIGHEFYREVEEKVYVPLSEAMRIRGKLDKQRLQAEAHLARALPAGRAEVDGLAGRHRHRLRRHGCEPRAERAAARHRAVESAHRGRGLEPNHGHDLDHHAHRAGHVADDADRDRLLHPPGGPRRARDGLAPARPGDRAPEPGADAPPDRGAGRQVDGDVVGADQGPVADGTKCPTVRVSAVKVRWATAWMSAGVSARIRSRYVVR